MSIFRLSERGLPINNCEMVKDIIIKKDEGVEL